MGCHKPLARSLLNNFPNNTKFTMIRKRSSYQKFIPLTLLLLLGCSGCQSLYLAFIENLAGSYANAHRLEQSGAEFTLRSISKINGRPYSDDAWVDLSEQVVEGLTVRLQAPATKTDDIQIFLNTQREGCNTALEQMYQAIAHGQRLLTQWSPGKDSPIIVLRLVPPNFGARQYEKTSGQQIDKLTLYLLKSTSH